MASRGGIYSSKPKKEVIPQYLVTDTRTHPNGFTVYKVVCRVADPDSLDCFKESFIWKRYSDFKELYKCLVTLHRKLYLNGKVPSFAKPKLFGRFEDSVVNERRESAENVLKFANQHPPLYKSAPFKEFFWGLRPSEVPSELKELKQAPLKPRKDEKSNNDADIETQEEQSSALTEDDLQFFDPFLSTKEFIASTSTNQDQDWIAEIKKSFKGEEVTGHDPESPDIAQGSLETEEDLEDLKIMLTENELQDYYNRQSGKIQPKAQSFDDAHNGSHVNTFSLQGQNPEVNMELGSPDMQGGEVDAREQHRKSSKASAYLEAVIRRNRLQSEDGGVKNMDEETSQLPVVPMGKPPGVSRLKIDESAKQERLGLGIAKKSSLLDLPRLLKDESSDDESKGAYLEQAAQQISFARAAENKLCFEEAFGHYKAAINTLLQGVQGDTNEARIQAVRRKTAVYLKRAEDIHSNHLQTTLNNSDLWKPQASDQRSSSPRTFLQTTDVQRTRRDTSSPVPAIPSPRHSSKDLACYKVLGSIGKVLLVLDTRSNETYALKILLKSCKNRQRKGVIPTNVPFMVRLFRYYSTEHAVCLLVEHAAGGRLWDQLAPYFELSRKAAQQDVPLKPKNQSAAVLSKRGLSSTPKKPTQEESRKDEEEEEKCSSSFLDLCMEYKTEVKDSTKGLASGGSKESPANATTDAEESKPLPNDENTLQEPEHHKSISEAIEDLGINSNDDDAIKGPNPQSNPEPKQLGLKRSWSYLSWDEGTVSQTETPAETDKTVPETGVFEGPPDPTTDKSQIDFKTVSSHSDIRLFTIDQDDQENAQDEPLDDSIYDSRSIDMSDAEDSGEEVGDKKEFTHELLSEQDMSAVSLCGDNIDKSLPSHLFGTEGPTVQGGSPILARLADASRGSPCLSMNSSFEEDGMTDGKNEDENTSNSQMPVVTRLVDENGVSSVDAVSFFRTHSRTRSESSHRHLSEDNPVIDEDRIEIDAIEEEDPPDENNKIHSIFVGMDVAKEKSMSYRIPESTVRMWGAEIVVAVGTLHSIAILCRDLNPNNVLLSSDGHIRLSYFGKWRQVERKPCDKLAVRRMYVAPEMSKIGEKKTEACDWWSVGAILYELMTGQPLYIVHPDGINSHTILSLPDHLSREAKSLLSGLLQYHPTQRLGYGVKGLDDLMDHPFFDGIEWDFLIENYVGS